MKLACLQKTERLSSNTITALDQPVLKIKLTIFAILGFTTILHAQYYLRGEIRDEKNNPLQNVRIILHSTSIPYASGIGGAFGILTTREKDTISLSLDGFESMTLPVNAKSYNRIEMKMLPFTASLYKHTRLSMTRNLKPVADKNRVMGDETYNTLVENEFIDTKRYPQTELILNVDRAAYSNIRRFINLNSMVPTDAVRIEEMLNYFSFNYRDPEGDSLFTLTSSLTSCPWNETNQLFYLHLSSRKINLENIPPSNLVFLIDVSGSMDMPNRLPLLKVAFRKLVSSLRPVDTVSIVVYGSVVGVMLQPTSGKEKEKIMEAIEELEPGGFTPGEAGILQAYRLAKSKYIKGGNNRVILATDGDFNIGQFSEKELEELITREKQSGVYLTCLGVGMGNYKDSKIEILAKRGNGNFAYLDTEAEAEKVLVKELTQTLYSIADDVYMSVSFNPSLVTEYRLIGFDNKYSAILDSSTNLEGGEIGSGHSMLAIFEVVPSEKNTLAVAEGIMKERIAQVDMHYREPGKKDHEIHTFDCPFNYLDFKETQNHLRFAGTVALFGLMLRGSPYVKNPDWEMLVELAKTNSDPNNTWQKEFAELVLKAQKIYQPVRKKKKKDDEQ
jgi:Ca-activated chloride channel family protein